MTKRHLRFLVMAVVLLLALLVPMVVMAAPVDQPPITHAIEGRENCTGCHQVGGAGVGAPGGTGMPTGHPTDNATCTGCHEAATAGETETPEATATAAPTEEGTATASPTAGGEQLPETGVPLPMMIPALVAGAAVVAGLGVKLLKK